MAGTQGDKGAHQNVVRVSLILSALAEASRTGLRLTDLVKATGLSKTAAHRFLAGMQQQGLVEQDTLSGRYFLGLNLVVWAAAAGNRYGLARLAEPALARLAEKTEDTVYLMLRDGDECICIARHEGGYPIRTLTLDLGDRRPLGAGAGPLAILSFLPDEEVDGILPRIENRLAAFKFDLVDMRRIIAETRQNGFATIDNRIIPGMSGVALPIRRQDGTAFASINVVAISARMAEDRRAWIATEIAAGAAAIERALGPLLHAEGVSQISRSSLAAKA
jgi:DNA-binding IclR family transcriptional regulator